jgi:ATP-dependent DNA helicase RecQ
MPELAAAAQLAERKVRVIVAQLVKAGVVARQARRLRRIREFESERALHEFLDSYDVRRRGDRERLDGIVRYAQATECRVRAIARYFAEPLAADCGRCDACRARAAGRLERPERRRRRPTPPTRPAPFARGDWVAHRTFGRGEVVAADAEGVTAVFAGVGEKRVDAGYLTKIHAA